jgi:cobalt-zinc-cadmium efflux system outer membrane protein
MRINRIPFYLALILSVIKNDVRINADINIHNSGFKLFEEINISSPLSDVLFGSDYAFSDQIIKKVVSEYNAEEKINDSFRIKISFSQIKLESLLNTEAKENDSGGLINGDNMGNINEKYDTFKEVSVFSIDYPHMKNDIGRNSLMNGDTFMAPPISAPEQAKDKADPTSSRKISLFDDPLLKTLVYGALKNRPELAQVQAFIKAEYDLIPQTGSLPDPVISFGIQNDGFHKIQVGIMETSWISIMASQTIPWFGKLGLRSDAARSNAQQAESDLKRVYLTIQAEVERAYINLLLIRDQLSLITKLENIWTQAEGIARVRFETGNGSQSDLLRTQLERNRLRQRRLIMEAIEKQKATALNRLCGRQMDEKIETNQSLFNLQDPDLPELIPSLADAEARSPEVEKARLLMELTELGVELAKKEYFPDFNLSFGIMPRGEKFDPMWQAEISVTLPIWSWNKLSHTVSENEARRIVASNSLEVVMQLLRQRVRERLVMLGALIETNHLYRSELLIQSEAAVKSTMYQYQVGYVTFATVLETIDSYLSDLNDYLDSVSLAQNIAIAHREISLDDIMGSMQGEFRGTSMPGVGSIKSSTLRNTKSSTSTEKDSTPYSSMSQM